MSDSGGREVRVLWVDDGSGSETGSALERDTERFDVVTVSSIRDGLARLDGRIDCIVARYDLPDGTGIDFLRDVRERSPDLPFVLFTEAGSEAIASDAISAGVTDYIRRDEAAASAPILRNRILAAVERRRAQREHAERQAELQRSERRLDAVFEDPKMLVGILSPDGRLRKANRTAMEFVDADHEDLVGQPFHETPWWTDDHRSDVRRWVERAADGEYVEYEADYGPVADERPSVSGTVRPVTDGTGEVVSLIVSARDITERRANERELRRRNERLNEVASIVSHDLQSPLNVARGHLELAREGGDGDDDHLAEVAHALDRATDLADDLLTLVSEGERVSEVEAVDVAAAVEDCWRNVATTDSSPSIDVDCTIRADPDQLQHLLENLLGNALRHGGTDVTVGGLDDGFYVADDGPGIPEDERERVFESGYSTVADGTGVGLSIVQRVADAHGWSIGITESAAGGARIEITDVECVSRPPAPN